MKICAFSVRDDERAFFEKKAKELNIEVVLETATPDLTTIEKAKGCDGISIITTPFNREMLEKVKDLGIKNISTRTIGYDHIDAEAAKDLGIGVSNISYSPNTVAEFAVMLILMGIRKLKQNMLSSSVQDYTVTLEKRAKELRNCTVGVIGTGRIGRTVIDILKGFGCKIVAYDLYQTADVEYLSLEDLLKTSDVITLHIPAVNGKPILGKKELDLLKKDVVLVNTARGNVLDEDALIEKLKKKEIGAFLADVVEREAGLYYFDLRGKSINNDNLHILKSFQNVVITPHIAFFTEEAVSQMVYHSLEFLARTK